MGYNRMLICPVCYEQLIVDIRIGDVFSCLKCNYLQLNASDFIFEVFGDYELTEYKLPNLHRPYQDLKLFNLEKQQVITERRYKLYQWGIISHVNVTGISWSTLS